MKIKDAERLLASHARLIAAAQSLVSTTDMASVAGDELRRIVRQVIDDAKQVRTQIARPL